ncbi:MAG TPA: hypothetical protein VFD82_07335 [Planctomycetota bacterium]|nr:hypothetical protein [Planctomycetota bacterium]
MSTPIKSLAAAALFASVALSQVAIPPHSATYNGFSRGFYFVAQTPFFITQLELPTNAQQAGDTASFLVRINGAVALHSVGNVGPSIPTCLPVQINDQVDVIGNWSPAVPGNFTAHNSYTASMTSFATTIEGVPHTIQRVGWQWDIGVTPLTGPYLPPTTGQMGRVLMYTSAVATCATNTTLGVGCIASFTSFYENFPSAATFDLANTAITMLSTGSGYVVTPGGAYLPVGSVQAVPTVLGLGDDTAVTQLFTTGSFPGAAGGLTVCSNGFVSLAPGNGTAFTPAVPTLLNDPQTSFRCWHDFNPTIVGSGQVKWEESAAVTVVTWDGVWDFSGTSALDASNLQFQFYSNGTVVIAWGTVSTLGVSGTGFLVGHSPGGPSANPGNTDLSALAALVLGTTDVIPLGLSATSRPVTGTSWNLQVNDIPATQFIGVDIFGLSDPGVPDLFFIGMPGCGLRSSLDVLNAYVGAGPHSYSLAIPSNPSLVGVHIYTTAASFQIPPVNAFGAITSNGIDGLIGNL